MALSGENGQAGKAIRILREERFASAAGYKRRSALSQPIPPTNPSADEWRSEKWALPRFQQTKASKAEAQIEFKLPRRVRAARPAKEGRSQHAAVLTKVDVVEQIGDLRAERQAVPKNRALQAKRPAIVCNCCTAAIADCFLRFARSRRSPATPPTPRGQRHRNHLTATD